MATAAASNNQMQTPGTGTSCNDIGANDMVNANFDLQKAFINMLSDMATAIAAFSEFQSAASQAVIAENKADYDTYMGPVDTDMKNGGSDWKPNGDDTVNMDKYQAFTQQNNATGQSINQSVSTDSSAYTNLMSAEQGNSSNMNTMVGDVIDTLLASMRLQS